MIDCRRAYIGTKMELKPEAFKGKMFKVNERKNFFEKGLYKSRSVCYSNNANDNYYCFGESLWQQQKNSAVSAKRS